MAHRTSRPMGRPLSSSEKTGLYLDSDLKRRLGIEALRRGITISELVTQAIKAFLARPRRAIKARLHPPAKAPAKAPESEQGLFRSEPEPQPEQPPRPDRAVINPDEEV